MKYQFNPVEAANAKNIKLRSPHKVTVRWLYFPVSGQKYRHYLRQKKHVEDQTKWLAVLETNELFNIKQAIASDAVPPFFAEIVEAIYKAKQKGHFVTEVSVGDNVSQMPLFDYETPKSWEEINKEQATQDKPTNLFSVQKPKVPTQKIPQSVLDILRKGKSS